MQNWQLAFDDYKKGLSIKEIAKKYNVAESTVRAWKSRKWNDDNIRNATLQRDAAQRNVATIQKNDDLTERQKLFCLYYLQCFSPTKAYRQAYPDASYNTAMVNGFKLMQKPKIKAELQRLKDALATDNFLELKNLVDTLTKQAFTDITDFVDFGTESETIKLDEPVITDKVDENGLPIMSDQKEIKYSYVRLKDSKEVDGSLIKSVVKGRDGVNVELYDKQKAIEMLVKYLDLDKLRNAEIAATNAKNGVLNDEEAADDGFLDALNAEGAELWPDE